MSHENDFEGSDGGPLPKERKRVGQDHGVEAWKVELVTEELLRQAWERGRRYVTQVDGRQFKIVMVPGQSGGTAYELRDCETGEMVDQVRPKALWTKTREQVAEFGWIGTTAEGELAEFETDR